MIHERICNLVCVNNENREGIVNLFTKNFSNERSLFRYAVDDLRRGGLLRVKEPYFLPENCLQILVTYL